MNWFIEHLQIIIAAAAAIAYFINRSRGTPDAENGTTSSGSPHEAQAQAERTRQIQEEIRKKIAARRAGAGETVQPPTATRERVPPLVRPTQIPPLDPFGGPMRRIIKEIEAAAQKSFEPQPDPEAAARAATLERQKTLAAEMRALEAQRLEEQRRVRAIALATKRRPITSLAGATASDVRSGLRDPRELRRAIVLREILGAPVGLR